MRAREVGFVFGGEGLLEFLRLRSQSKTREDVFVEGVELVSVASAVFEVIGAAAEVAARALPVSVS